GKDLKADIPHEIIHIGELQRNAQVGSVRTKATHGLLPAHGGETVWKWHLDGVIENLTHHVLENLTDFHLVKKGHLAINLGKLRLPIGPQILVPEAFGDLVIAVKAGHHQHLLKQLG